MKTALISASISAIITLTILAAFGLPAGLKPAPPQPFSKPMTVYPIPEGTDVCDFKYAAPGIRPGNYVTSTVKHITEDNEIIVTHFGNNERNPHTTLRLWGIATPGRDAPGYKKSIEYLQQIVQPGKTLKYYKMGTLPDQAMAAIVLVDDYFINESLLREGLAIKLTGLDLPTPNTCFTQALDDAQRNGRGIWGPPKPQSMPQTGPGTVS